MWWREAHMNKYLLYAGLILLGAVFSGKIKGLPVVGPALSKVGG
jgi:hypothetical protein